MSISIASKVSSGFLAVGIPWCQANHTLCKGLLSAKMGLRRERSTQQEEDRNLEKVFAKCVLGEFDCFFGLSVFRRVPDELRPVLCRL